MQRVYFSTNLTYPLTKHILDRQIDLKSAAKFEVHRLKQRCFCAVIPVSPFPHVTKNYSSHTRNRKVHDFQERKHWKKWEASQKHQQKHQWLWLLVKLLNRPTIMGLLHLKWSTETRWENRIHLNPRCQGCSSAQLASSHVGVVFIRVASVLWTLIASKSNKKHMQTNILCCIST